MPWRVYVDRAIGPQRFRELRPCLQVNFLSLKIRHGHMTFQVRCWYNIFTQNRLLNNYLKVDKRFVVYHQSKKNVQSTRCRSDTDQWIYTAVISAEELTKAETYTIFRVYLFILNNRSISLNRQHFVANDTYVALSIHRCPVFFWNARTAPTSFIRIQRNVMNCHVSGYVSWGIS
jgi:hypothetical protein